jgi:hypothetical protein
VAKNINGAVTAEKEKISLRPVTALKSKNAGTCWFLSRAGKDTPKEKDFPGLKSFKRAGQKGQRSYGLPGADCSKVPKDYGIKQSSSPTPKDTIYSVSFWPRHGSPPEDSFLFVLFLLKVFYGLSDTSGNRQT